jgi:hypothetical protein
MVFGTQRSLVQIQSPRFYRMIRVGLHLARVYYLCREIDANPGTTKSNEKNVVLPNSFKPLQAEDAVQGHLCRVTVGEGADQSRLGAALKGRIYQDCAHYLGEAF